jgi:hypothetical protein
VHTEGDFTRDAPGRKGEISFKKGSISRVVVVPCSSCILRALPPSGPLDGGALVSAGGKRVRAIPSGDFIVGEPALAAGLSILSSSCCY